MADEKSSGSWGGSFVVLAFAAVSAVYVALQQPNLVSTRPNDTEYQVHDLKGLAQDVESRLWQDPFDAVMRDIDDRRARNPQPSGSRLGDPQPGDHDRVGFREFDNERTLVLGVTLPGAPYPEVAETRRRLRYAVLAALHVARYTPTDEKHIGYWRPKSYQPTTDAPQTEVRMIQTGWPEAIDVSASGKALETGPGIGIAIRVAAGAAPTGTGPATDQPPLPPIVPWEEFDNDQKQHVLVLWLDEDVLTAGRKPIASLDKLRSQLTSSLNDSTFALLGPEDSTMLRAMVHEQSPPKSAGFSVYNFGATAEEKKILGHNDTIREFLFERSRIRYYRMVESDGELATALGCELMRRDPNLRLPNDANCVGLPKPNGPRDHVVLISDWDTVYGKDLRDSVAEAFGGADPMWIREVDYLRGIDGRLPDRKYPSQPAPSQNNNLQQTAVGQAPANRQTATPETANQFESAEGQSQFDYLRRLAADLKKRDTAYRREPQDGGHIGAIGVLGSDVYDKLLILQALRPELPDALFFTTDLDELLLPQKKTRYTRNLLVASSFGLTLTEQTSG